MRKLIPETPNMALKCHQCSEQADANLDTDDVYNLFLEHMIRKEQQITFAWISTNTCFLFLPPNIQISVAGRRKTFANRHKETVKRTHAGIFG